MISGLIGDLSQSGQKVMHAFLGELKYCPAMPGTNRQQMGGTGVDSWVATLA
jgi:hypothetical protein